MDEGVVGVPDKVVPVDSYTPGRGSGQHVDRLRKAKLDVIRHLEVSLD